uniref:Uncharacterized protein n=1 Tax=Romanomermis culicivorax TaxID=13658 RepID=A0A915HNM0_ROMCU
MKIGQQRNRYLSCFNECDQKEIIKDCGKMASSVMKGLLAKSVEVMKSMFETMRLPVEMPQECNDVMVWRLNFSALEDTLAIPHMGFTDPFKKKLCD